MTLSPCNHCGRTHHGPVNEGCDRAPDPHHWPPAFDLVNADFGKIEHHVMHYTRGYSKQALQDAVLFGRGVDLIMIDEYHHIPYLDYIKFDVLPPKEKDWGNKRKFVSGPETPPSKSKRAKLRAKRKKRTK